MLTWDSLAQTSRAAAAGNEGKSPSCTLFRLCASVEDRLVNTFGVCSPQSECRRQAGEHILEFCSSHSEMRRTGEHILEFCSSYIEIRKLFWPSQPAVNCKRFGYNYEKRKEKKRKYSWTCELAWGCNNHSKGKGKEELVEELWKERTNELYLQRVTY